MKIDARVLILGPAALFVSESVAFLVKPFQIPASVATTLYPPGRLLLSHCAEHACLYNALAVSSLYSIQLMTFLIFVLSFYLAGRSNPKPVEQSGALICGLLLIGVFIDYLSADFTFHRIWIFPNSVAESPLGLFRFAIGFSIASVCAAAIENVGVKGKADANG